MIPEIGLVLVLYVIARLTANARPVIARTTAGLAIALALLVAVELAVRGVTSESLLTKFASGRAPANAEEPTATSDSKLKSTGTVTRADGGSISTQLSPGIVVAENSSLKREWIAVHEPAFPVDVAGTPGVTTVYVHKQYGGDYAYRVKFNLTAAKTVRAVEVRFLVFNLWGDHVRSLSYEDVSDITAGATKEVSAQWNLPSENEVEQHYASIGYVARVRLDDGTVVEAPIDTVLEEARRFSAKFTPEQLGPKL